MTTASAYFVSESTIRLYKSTCIDYRCIDLWLRFAWQLYRKIYTQNIYFDSLSIMTITENAPYTVQQVTLCMYVKRDTFQLCLCLILNISKKFEADSKFFYIPWKTWLQKHILYQFNTSTCSDLSDNCIFVLFSCVNTPVVIVWLISWIGGWFISLFCAHVDFIRRFYHYQIYENTLITLVLTDICTCRS